LQNGAAVSMRDPDKKSSTDGAPKPAATTDKPASPAGTRKGP